MIKFIMSKRQLCDMKIYQVVANCGEERNIIAIGEPKATGIEAFLSVSNKLILYAEQLRAMAKELREKSADIGLSAEEQADSGSYFYMDENSFNNEGK